MNGFRITYVLQKCTSLKLFLLLYLRQRASKPVSIVWPSCGHCRELHECRRQEAKWIKSEKTKKVWNLTSAQWPEIDCLFSVLFKGSMQSSSSIGLDCRPNDHEVIRDWSVFIFSVNSNRKLWLPYTVSKPLHTVVWCSGKCMTEKSNCGQKKTYLDSTMSWHCTVSLETFGSHKQNSF